MLTGAGIEFPVVCPAPAHIEVCAPWRGAPSGYDYSAVCEPFPGAELDRPFGCDGNNTIGDEYVDECAEARAQSVAVVLFWVTIALYMFYGMALVCEEFMVPALNIFCLRHGIPSNVAGATLLAAGCNAPELIASAISIFVTRSTVGAGTVIGSAPFNICFICGASAVAVGGIEIDRWLLAREAIALLSSLAMLLWVLSDNMVQWWQALALVLGFVGYVVVCVRWEAFLRFVSPTPPVGYRSIEAAAAEDATKLIVPSPLDEPSAEWARAVAAASARVRGAAAAAGARIWNDAAADVAPGSMRGMLLKRNPFYMPAATARAAHRAWQARYFVLDVGERPLRYMRLSSSGAPDASSATRIDLAASSCIELHPSGTGSQLTIVTRPRAAMRGEDSRSTSTSTSEAPMSPTTPLPPGLKAASLLAGAALDSPKQLPRSGTAPLPRFRESSPLARSTQPTQGGAPPAGFNLPALEMPPQMIVGVNAPPVIAANLRPGVASHNNVGAPQTMAASQIRAAEQLHCSIAPEAAVGRAPVTRRPAAGRRSADDVFTRQRQAALRARWLPTSSSWSFPTVAADTEHVHELRLLPDVDASELRRWRDHIVLNIEQLRHSSCTPCAGAPFEPAPHLTWPRSKCVQ